MKTSSARRRVAPIKLNTVDVAVRPRMNDVGALITRRSCQMYGIPTEGLSREWLANTESQECPGDLPMCRSETRILHTL